MIYKTLIIMCLLSLSACETKYLGETAHAKSIEQQKIETPQSDLSPGKILHSSKDIKKALDNKIYLCTRQISQNPYPIRILPS